MKHTSLITPLFARIPSPRRDAVQSGKLLGIRTQGQKWTKEYAEIMKGLNLMATAIGRVDMDAVFVSHNKYWDVLNTIQFLVEKTGVDFKVPVLLLEDLVVALRENASVFKPELGKYSRLSLGNPTQ